MKSRIFQDFIVFDEQERCPYLPGETARMPLAVPGNAMSGAEADRRFAAGQRRSGEFVYTTECPTCRACQPIRLNIDRFKPNASQRKAWRRGLQVYECEFGPLVSDEAHVDLFNRHRSGRGLERDSPVDLESYAWGLGRSCFDAFEIRYRAQGQLVGIAICDLGQISLSAVYTYYDPQFLRWSPGTFSIMRQVEYCRENRLQYLYLGFYIAESNHMAYKGNYRPHERLCQGQWTEFE